MEKILKEFNDRIFEAVAEISKKYDVTPGYVLNTSKLASDIKASLEADRDKGKNLSAYIRHTRYA